MLYCLDTLPNLIFIPVPPTNIFQFLNCLIIKAFAYRFCWNTTNNGIWLNIFCYNSPASYDCTVSNCNPGKNNCFIANPKVSAYIKKLKRYADRLYLVSLNSKYSPIEIKESDRLDVFGKVVGKINSNDVPDYRF